MHKIILIITIATIGKFTIGNNALSVARYQGHTEVVNILLENGAIDQK